MAEIKFNDVGFAILPFYVGENLIWQLKIYFVEKCNKKEKNLSPFFL